MCYKQFATALIQELTHNIGGSCIIMKTFLEIGDHWVW